MDTMRQQGWIFSWSKEVLDGTPMWYSWAKIDFSLVQWNVLLYDSFGFLVSLLLLGALKYSVAVTSLSTLFGREISPDHEMKVIGMANIVSGLLGCCGGCHYLSAMGILQQFGADEKAPAFICAIFFLFIWFQGFFILQYVPKFIFGGLILSVGIHFLETYFFKPFEFLKFFEKIIVLGITISFLCIGMLQSVGLGILISMLDLIYRIHEIGCVHHETTGVLSRSAVDRTREQSFFLDSNGNAIFILRLQGYLFFGTSVNLIERLETRIHSRDEFGKIQFVIVDFGLVPNVDATALFNLKKMVFLA
jgi:SulP family sulfate permease